MTDALKRKIPLGWMDALRHLLSLAVIFQHMPASNRYPTEVNAFISNWVPAVDGAVACFFLLSGFFANPDFRWAVLKRQVARLIMPYVLFCFLYGAALIFLHKLTVAESAWRTVSGAGVGPQLYFLPYLLLISTAANFVLSYGGKVLSAVVVIAFFVAYLAFPTAMSTGAEPRLLILYALAYAIGFYRARHAGTREIVVLLVASALGVLLFTFRSRYFDLFLILLLIEAAIQLSSRLPLPMRLPGSGGVYLLHTPLLNYAISIMLWKLGIVSIANVFASLAFTYMVALGITMAFRHFTTRYRWLLLE